MKSRERAITHMAAIANNLVILAFLFFTAAPLLKIHAIKTISSDLGYLSI
jgi:hypothetical protein